jgi:hypothetical protein
MNLIKLTRGKNSVIINMDNVTHITKEFDGGSEIEFVSRNSGATMGSVNMSDWTHGRCYVDQTPDEICEICLK